MASTMNIAVIGAGPAGLASLKYSLDEAYDCDVFEQTGTLGGTWVYTDKLGIDESGIPIHSSMYKGLRTNLPKEVMYFLDFPYPDTKIKSYLDQREVLEYFNHYAKFFNLQKHIKYFKCVTHVEPLNNLKWALTIKDVKSGSEEVREYNAVFVCNGHYSTPRIPILPGHNLYKGIQVHSHDYRTPEPYLNKRVLVIGAGSSGTDIARIIAESAKRVFLSHRYDPKITYRENLTSKPEVTNFYDTGVTFQDNTKEEIDAVLYCTGYTFTYPFLSKACGISVEDNWVRPLYKHIVNINHPTMFFIGIPMMVPIIPVCDIQVRFALAELKKKFLPKRVIMLKELEDYVEDRKLKNIPPRHYHQFGFDTLRNYFLELSEVSGVRPVPTVIINLFATARMTRNPEDCFKIIDEENFIQLPC